ncbi:uncharacterized protein LOC126353822 [Schistocerca gregaria]|uniref:uncharacterized protein LOC126353822 n=1 Tax=Schistocerca gregaria TaxID=7010 RepID=UPI00211F2846|nr:uncharacterized protein LOC126353822 [Schistocerca gregaria]
MGGLWRLVLCSLASSALLVAAEEENPFVEMAKTFLKEQMQGQGGSSGAGGALGAVGAMMQSFMQGGGGRQLGDLLKDSDFVATVGSALAGAAGKEAYGDSPNSGVIDPQLIADLVGAFTSGHSDENNNDVKQGRDLRDERRPQQQGQVDWSSMLDLALSLAGGTQQDQPRGGGNPLQGLLGLLPALMQAASSGESPRSEGAGLGEARPSLFAPVLAAFRDYWEHFMSSELGQTLWKTSGLEATFRLFTDKDGNLDTERIYRSLENASFRKRWVRSLATYVSEWIAHVSDPSTQKRYLTTAQFMGNGFLKAQGYPKSVMFDPARPSESLTRIVNAVFKKQFGLKIDSATYIKPAVAYLQEVFKLGQAKGLSLSHLSPKEIEDKLTDTISGHIIEPAMRVWRAYWYATRHPQCEEYVICTVNQRDTATEGGLKPGVTKLSSMVAIWILSSNNGSSFWKLYSAAVEGHDCAIQYPANCGTFHEEDIKATTEYIHSEL